MTSQAGPAPDTDARTAPVVDATDVGIWWDELVAVSMLGTARRDPPPLPAALGVPDPTGPREDRLLAAATAAMVLRSAGRRPEPTRDVPAAAPELM